MILLRELCLVAGVVLMDGVSPASVSETTIAFRTTQQEIERTDRVLKLAAPKPPQIIPAKVDSTG